MLFNENPFYILNASPRDSKTVIHQKAEDKIFTLPEDICKDAERLLMNPKKRLEAEIAWFPGLSPKKIDEIVASTFDKKLLELFDDLSEENALVKANKIALFFYTLADNPKLMAEIFDFYKSIASDDESPDEILENSICNDITALCREASQIVSDTVLDLINGDRISAGFPEISDLHEWDRCIEVQKIFYKQTIKRFLDCLDSSFLVCILTDVIETVTKMGNAENPWPLLDDLISDYEMEVIPFFDKQESVISKDIEKILTQLSEQKQRDHISPHLNKLDLDVKLWDQIAQPIQVAYKSCGKEHKRSATLAIKIRNLALTSYNKYHNTDVAQRISSLMETVFAEVPFIAETISEDIHFLSATAANEKIISQIIEVCNKHKVIASDENQATVDINTLINSATPLIAKLSSPTEGKNFLATALIHYAIEYVNHQKDYKTGLLILQKADSFASDPKLQEQIAKNKIILYQNQAYTESKRKDRIAMFKWFGVIAIIFAIGGGIIGGCDRSENVGAGILGGLGFFAVLLVIGFLQNINRWR